MASDQFSITNLVRRKLMPYRFSYFSFIVSMEISITLTHSIKLQSFSKIWSTFHIDQSKGRSIKRQLKIDKTPIEKVCHCLEKTVSNHLKQNLCLHCTIDLDRQIKLIFWLNKRDRRYTGIVEKYAHLYRSYDKHSQGYTKCSNWTKHSIWQNNRSTLTRITKH